MKTLEPTSGLCLPQATLSTMPQNCGKGRRTARLRIVSQCANKRFYQKTRQISAIVRDNAFHHVDGIVVNWTEGPKVDCSGKRLMVCWKIWRILKLIFVLNSVKDS
jgi:hypothetical protein